MKNEKKTNNGLLDEFLAQYRDWYQTEWVDTGGNPGTPPPPPPPEDEG